MLAVPLRYESLGRGRNPHGIILSLRMSRTDLAGTARPPRIAISATTYSDDHRRRVRVNAAYVDAIERAGALPLVVPPLSSLSHTAAIIDACDGLVLTGGEDIDPTRYHAPRDATVDDTNPDRDATEIALVEAARAVACPTFAICRGLQLLNVALGGSLVQDIPSQRPGSLDHDPKGPRSARVHDVDIEAGSALARTLGSTRLRVNSFHHQAADRVAEGLRATAWAPDGIIEGLEWRGPGDWWAVAVQWHPEELVVGPEPAPDASLFAEFVRRAASSRRD
jgi:putative glutamine amidotransferase